MVNCGYWTVNEVSKMLGRHRNTVIDMIKIGELPAYKIGAQWKIGKDELKEWLLSMSNRSKTRKENDVR